VATVRFEGAGKRFGGVDALVDLHLDIEDGELAVLVGPSGSGKTTALRLLAGLESITSGHVWIGDKQVDALPPRDRDIAMVFQDYALYPQMTVYKNLAFGLRMRKVAPGDIDGQVLTAAKTLGLEDLLERRPRELSGGQRQRVALGRALVRQPQVFLMDEPLSNLDAKLRTQTRVEIARIQREFGITTVYVTHDQIEAMTLGRRVAVMRDGRLQQFDSPKGLYDRPANLFVASFIGSPAMNITEGSLEHAGDGLAIAFGDHRLAVGRPESRPDDGIGAYAGRKVLLGIRPEAMADASLARGTPEDRRMTVRVELREDVGSDVYAYFEGGPPVSNPGLAESPTGDDDEAGGNRRRTFVARLSPQSKAREGDAIQIAINDRALFFFDPDTGVRIG